MPEYKFLGKENVQGKTIAIRVDLNSDVEEGELFESARLKKHAETLKQLSGKGAKLVVLAHQGRKGQADCVSLKQHAESISEKIEKEVKLVSWDSDYVSAIGEMQPGEIILLENVRFNDREEQEFTADEAGKVEWVQKIAAACQTFVQDSLSVCHRSQPSVVGFASLPSFVGPVLESELKALEHFDKGERPAVFVLGGAKVHDSISLMQTLLEKGKADAICVGGLLGELFLKAKGISLGDKDRFFEEKGLNGAVEQAKQLLSQYSESIVIPIDVAIMNDYDEREELMAEELPKENMIYDIGMETAGLFKESLKKAKLIVMNGPMGVFEKMEFEAGTKKLFEAISKSRAFSIIGGGDTEAALEEMGLSPGQFSHVSLAGKALLLYLTGKDLPGLSVLKK